MEMTIGTDTVVMLAELLSALGVIGGVVLWLFKFVQRSSRQAEELRSIRKEQTLICYGLLACLKGLKEQGCNGPVTTGSKSISIRLRTTKRAEGKSCSKAFPRLPEKRRRLKHERILRYGERYIMNQIDWKRNPNTFPQLFKKYGVTMYPEDIGELLHLRKDTLRVEPSQTRIIQLKSPDQQDRGN